MSFKEIASIKIGTFSVGGICSAVIAALLCLVAIRVLLSIGRRLLKKTKMDQQVQKYILYALKLLLYIVGTIIVVDSLGVPISSLIALLSVCGLALSLAVEGILGNMAGGLVLLATKPFGIGDYIEASGVSGSVAEILLHCTKLDTVDGRRVILPNKGLADSQLVNYTTLGRRRVEHTVCASYEAAPDEVKAACREAIAQTAGVLADPAATVNLSAYKDSAIEYVFRCWCKSDDYLDVYYETLENIHKSFRRHGIDMTYAHLNVHMVEK